MNAKKYRGKKIAAILLAVVLLVGGAIGGTLAWLTAESEAVTNTFTVGNIEIDLKEHELKADGTLDTNNAVTENNNYKIVPGGTQPKDPFVTVESGSEKCYVYVCITNDLVIGTDVVGTYNINEFSWTEVKAEGNKTLYRFNEIVDAATADETRQVFSKVTYDGAKITADNIQSLKDKTITVQAYAHQSDNTTQDVADAAATALFFPTP